MIVPDQFTYSTEERNGVLIISLRGGLDIGSVPQIMSEFNTWLAKGQYHIVLELSQLQHLDSSGIGAILRLFKHARQHKGDIKIARLQGQPREIFRLLDLTRCFEIFDDLEAAVRSFPHKVH